MCVYVCKECTCVSTDVAQAPSALDKVPADVRKWETGMIDLAGARTPVMAKAILAIRPMGEDTSEEARERLLFCSL